MACALYILNSCEVHRHYLRKAVGPSTSPGEQNWTQALPSVAKVTYQMATSWRDEQACSQLYKLRVPGYKLRVPGYKPRVPGYKQRVPGYKSRVLAYKLMASTTAGSTTAPPQLEAEFPL